MKSALQLRSDVHPASSDDGYATDAEIQRIFGTEMVDLARLALLLTANGEEAERCLILAIRDCFKNREICKEQARIWVRQALVRVAIRLVLGANETALAHSSSHLATQHFTCSHENYPMAAPPESAAILHLPGFERLVFVMCAFEGYDVRDCAALLGRTQKDVHAAMARAIGRIVYFEAQEKNETNTAAFREAAGGDDTCGTLLE